ncbi:Alpha/Beta hydrolase protein [Mycena albidolilacea]|uniref:Carboxylic ester hydrolase n=1 Tax=Mycena albidolilacea TaxID=1033008 RepID=A0AAD6ZTI8_9AGAR|nr:Alpha/Beta hydrolase protein [Mycena albidolilacea]
MLLRALGIGRLLATALAAVPFSTVTLDYGTFTGLTNASTGIIYFRGVRFADPPLGDLRWRAPVSPPSTHLGHVNASQFGPACIPTSASEAVPGATSEDCLFGNVFIPINTQPTSKLPVLVYFHGGGFEAGSAVGAPPDELIQGSAKPLIFVTFQYRLGQFGFLGGSEVAQDGLANAGLWDQRAALEWVQRYISSFGGDPGQVTIWGQSAGAGSTMYHLIAEGGKDKRLFHRVMGDSPPLLAMPANTDAFVENLFAQFAALAGCGGITNPLSCLRAAPTDRLALGGSSTLANRISALFPLGPILDGKFITQRPVEAFRDGHFVRVPVFFGSNTNEGTHWSAELHNPAANTSEPSATEDTVFNFLAGQWPGLTRATFARATSAALYPQTDFANFSLQGQQLYGEMRFICTAILITGTFRDVGLDAFGYHWDNPILGSDHAAELQMFYNLAEVFDPLDAELAIAMREYWTSFATDGVPRAKGSPVWKTAGTTGSPRMLLHPGQVGMEDVSDELKKRCAFWHNRELIEELDT